MNHTTNYNFNVPVGSDVVNPLVQDFPNWESLDSILKNIANTGITTATHTKAGTIHTLSFTETTIPMIRFQATANFNTNDTFTVNGVSVSALTVSGESLPDGAFVIGSMVLCELRDNLLTVYSSGTDAETLEGHPASYFATATDLNTVDDKVDANKTLIDSVLENITWKTLNPSTPGGKVFSLAGITYNELDIEVVIPTPGSGGQPLIVIPIRTSIHNSQSTNLWLVGGRSVTDINNSSAIVVLSTTNVLSLSNAIYNGEDYLSYASISVKYR